MTNTYMHRSKSLFQIAGSLTDCVFAVGFATEDQNLNSGPQTKQVLENRQPFQKKYIAEH
jgi:hypothetical protein